jgi:ParB-like nuclease domain
MNPKNLYMTEDFSNRDERVNNFFNEMKANGYGKFPPVLVFKDGNIVYVLDGNHRVKAARWASISWIPVEYASESDLPKYGFRDLDTLQKASTY